MRKSHTAIGAILIAASFYTAGWNAAKKDASRSLRAAETAIIDARSAIATARTEMMKYEQMLHTETNRRVDTAILQYQGYRSYQAVPPGMESFKFVPAGDHCLDELEGTDAPYGGR